MKRPVLVFTTVLFAMAALPAYYVLRIRQIDASYRNFLIKQIDHQPVAEACRDILTKPEYKSLLGQFVDGNDNRLPGAIRTIKPIWLSINTNEVLIMKMGGHYHMGLIFRLASTDRYDLVFREEKDLDHDIHLFSLTKKKAEPGAAANSHPR